MGCGGSRDFRGCRVEEMYHATQDMKRHEMLMEIAESGVRCNEPRPSSLKMRHSLRRLHSKASLSVRGVTFDPALERRECNAEQREDIEGWLDETESVPAGASPPAPPMRAGSPPAMPSPDVEMSIMIISVEPDEEAEFGKECHLTRAVLRRHNELVPLSPNGSRYSFKSAPPPHTSSRNLLSADYLDLSTQQVGRRRSCPSMGLLTPMGGGACAAGAMRRKSCGVTGHLMPGFALNDAMTEVSETDVTLDADAPPGTQTSSPGEQRHASPLASLMVMRTHSGDALTPRSNMSGSLSSLPASGTAPSQSFSSQQSPPQARSFFQSKLMHSSRVVETAVE